jgi:hypothetical protein
MYRKDTSTVFTDARISSSYTELKFDIPFINIFFKILKINFNAKISIKYMFFGKKMESKKCISSTSKDNKQNKWITIQYIFTL